MACDSVMHESFTHLGMGHLVCETFAIAHHNAYVAKKNLKGHEGIHELLAAHFVDLLGLNSLARLTLVAPINDSLRFFMGVPGSVWPKMISKWYTRRYDIWN